jgi:tRNA pseudouridine38-40 synthase
VTAKRSKVSSSFDPETEPTAPYAVGEVTDPRQPRHPQYKRRKVAILLGYFSKTDTSLLAEGP